MDLGDIVKMTVFLTNDNNRAAINKYWNECFPDPHKRPARHSLVLPLRGGVLLNRNLGFIDHINEIVYPEGSLAFGSQGTLTVSSNTLRLDA